MHLTGLQLENFRNHRSLVQTFSPEITLIHGPNGTGKTNILEAIYLLSTGKSNRAGKVIELINWEADLGRVLGKLDASESTVIAPTRQIGGSEARQSSSDSAKTSEGFTAGSATTPISLATSDGILRDAQNDGTSDQTSPALRAPSSSSRGEAESSSMNHEPSTMNSLKLEITLTRGQLHGQKTPYKKFTLDGVARSQKKFAHQFNVVWFGPADMRLIEGSPTRRRDFLDETISQINPEYAHAIRELTKLLPRRNQVLFQIREGSLPLNQLKYWDQQLCLLSEQIHTARQAFVDYINAHNLHQFQHYFLEYTPKTITFDALPEIRNREIAATTTLRGPHRDEFDVLDTSLRGSPVIAPARQIGGSEVRQSGSNQSSTHSAGISGQARDDSMPETMNREPSTMNSSSVSLRTYGSRGQQRMAIIWLKLMALEFIAADRGVRPILLLDDVMSELDTDHRTIIQDLITKQQTIITSAEHLKLGQTEETQLNP